MSDDDGSGMSDTTDGKPELLRIYLHGGQTIEKVVTYWELKKSNVTAELTELRWKEDGEESLPYLRLNAVDAVTIHPVTDPAAE